MKSFIKYAFATGVGVMIGSFLVVIVFVSFIGIMIGLASQKEVAPSVQQGFLTIELEKNIGEKSDNLNIDVDGLFDRYQKIGLYELTHAIELAEEDDDIKGIYLRIRNPKSGWATLEAIRNTLEDFKLNSKKPIFAYSDQMNERSYYLASVADKIYMHEIGDFEFNGFAATPSFFKGLLDKLQIKPMIFRVGKYKSPVEPFFLTKMSKEDREQMGELLDDFWSEFVGPASSYRKIPTTQLERLANDLVITEAKKAQEYKLIDQVIVESELLAMMGKEAKLETEKDGTILIGVDSYIKRIKEQIYSSGSGDNELAIVFFDGVIVSGNGKKGQIGSDDFVQTIWKLAKDSEVKGVILRINSPGGSALASDVIWAELELLAKKKPVFASFGDMAASGGYYIASAAERIYASPFSLTGSIGVFGVMFNSEQFFGNKLGVTFDRVVTNDYADIGSGVRPMKNYEKNVIQGQVEAVYTKFLDVVQRGRKYPSDGMLDSVAQGRVWSGKSALKMGLVDELGGLDDALEGLSKQLKLEEYRIGLYPQTNGLKAIFNQIGGAANILSTFKQAIGIDKIPLRPGVWAMDCNNWSID